MSVENAKRVVFTAPGEVEIQSWEPGEVGAGQMLIENRFTMISPGTELHNLLNNHSNDTSFPRNSGYIGFGRIAQVGGDVTDFKVGDEILNSSSHLSHIVVDADRGGITRLPDDVPAETAIFSVLCGIALYGVRNAQIETGEAVLISGQGLIGQLAAQFARIEGARPVIAVDMDDGRLELSMRCGAHETINPGKVDMAEAVEKATGGRGVNKIIEATGTTHAIGQAFSLCALGGTVIVLGGIHGKVELDLYSDFQRKGLTMKGVHGPQCPKTASMHYTYTYDFNRDTILRLMASGDLIIDPLRTHLVPYAEAPDIYKRLQNRDTSALGVIFDWSEIHSA